MTSTTLLHALAALALVVVGGVVRATTTTTLFPTPHIVGGQGLLAISASMGTNTANCGHFCRFACPHGGICHTFDVSTAGEPDRAWSDSVNNGAWQWLQDQSYGTTLKNIECACNDADAGATVQPVQTFSSPKISRTNGESSLPQNLPLCTGARQAGPQFSSCSPLRSCNEFCAESCGGVCDGYSFLGSMQSGLGDVCWIADPDPSAPSCGGTSPSNQKTSDNVWLRYDVVNSEPMQTLQCKQCVGSLLPAQGATESELQAVARNMTELAQAIQEIKAMLADGDTGLAAITTEVGNLTQKLDDHFNATFVCSDDSAPSVNAGSMHRWCQLRPQSARRL